MKVKVLRRTICDVAGSLLASGVEPGRQTLQAVIELCEGHDEESVDTLLAGLRHRLTRPTPTVCSQADSTDHTVVARYVQRLQEVGMQQSAFDGVFDALSKDKAVRKCEADAIAHAYTGGRPKWPTKREALEAIETWYNSRAFDKAKMSRV